VKKFLQALWPVWLPYPSAWLQSLINILFGSLPFYWTTEIFKGHYTTAKGASVALLASLLIFAAPFVVYSYIYSFLWGDAPKDWPKRVPSPKGIYEGFFAFCAFLLSVTVAVIVTLFVVKPEHLYLPEATPTSTAAIVVLSWYISLTYLYHVKNLTWKGIVKELKIKAQGDTPPADSNRAKAIRNPNPNPVPTRSLVDAELAQMRREMNPFGEFTGQPSKEKKR
jgi:hypothetical protein